MYYNIVFAAATRSLQSCSRYWENQSLAILCCYFLHVSLLFWLHLESVLPPTFVLDYISSAYPDIIAVYSNKFLFSQAIERIYVFLIRIHGRSLHREDGYVEQSYFHD